MPTYNYYLANNRNVIFYFPDSVEFDASVSAEDTSSPVSK